MPIHRNQQTSMPFPESDEELRTSRTSIVGFHPDAPKPSVIKQGALVKIIGSLMAAMSGDP
jgi:hypothetical protein